MPAWMKGSWLSTVKVNKCTFSATREAALWNRFSFAQSINKAELVFRRGDFARFIAVLEKLSVDEEDFRKSYKA